VTPKTVEALAAALLAYIVVLVGVDVSWPAVARHVFVPHLELTSEYTGLLVAVLGTTLSPYLLFWQSVHRVEDLRAEPEGGGRALPLRRWWRRDAKRKQKQSRFDVFSGFVFSNLVMFAIIVSTAETLGRQGHARIDSAAEAARALRPISGQLASTLFALGFIGSGMLAVPVLAGAGAAGLSGLAGRTSGYSRSPRQAPVFYGLVLLGTLGGTALSLLDVNPIRLLVFSAVVNGLAAAPFMAVVMLIAGSRPIMGRYVNGTLANVLGWAATAVMTLAAVLLLTVGRGGGLY
jgi:Mn2+/Fe2+ NRAMP family transporter